MYLFVTAIRIARDNFFFDPVHRHAYINSNSLQNFLSNCLMKLALRPFPFLHHSNPGFEAVTCEFTDENCEYRYYVAVDDDGTLQTVFVDDNEGEYSSSIKARTVITSSFISVSVNHSNRLFSCALLSVLYNGCTVDHRREHHRRPSHSRTPPTRSAQNHPHDLGEGGSQLP